MEQTNENRETAKKKQRTTNDNGHSFIDEILRRLALPAIIISAFIIILFGLIIHFQPMPTVSNTVMPTETAQIAEENTPAPTETPEPDKQYTVIVDAGHGLPDCGALDYTGERYESDYNLYIAQKLETVLKEHGFNVIMTRTDENCICDDPTLKDITAIKNNDMDNRVKIINASNADMFISIHQNQFNKDPSVTGPEVYYDDSNPPEGMALARCIQDALIEEFDVKKPRAISPDNLMVIDPLPCSVLVECGFISNKEEAENLLDPAYQQRVAEAIFQGLENYIAANLS